MSGLSRAPPPRRGQQNLLGFMCMSSGQRFSLEQLMVKTGQLDPVSSGAAAAVVVGGVAAAAAAAAAPAPLDHF